MTFKKIIVTGASGFLGGRTLKEFKVFYPEAQLLGTGRRSARKKEFAEFNCDFISGDLSDLDFCSQLCNQADLVIHCAALSSPWGDFKTFYNANVLTTKNLTRAAKEEGVSKFIFVSTPSIYFEHKDRFRVSESEALPKKLVNNYAITKLEAEQHVLEQNSDNFQTLAIRPRAIIGAEDTVIMPRVLKAYREGKLKIIGDGENTVDLTCVRNVVEALRCASIASAEAFGKSYNITDGEPVKLWEEINYMLGEMKFNKVHSKIPLAVGRFAAKLSEKWAILTNKDEPTLTDYGIGVLARNFTMDISLAKEFLNYNPIISTRQGIDEFVTWYKMNRQ